MKTRGEPDVAISPAVGRGPASVRTDLPDDMARVRRPGPTELISPAGVSPAWRKAGAAHRGCPLRPILVP